MIETGKWTREVVYAVISEKTEWRSGIQLIDIILLEWIPDIFFENLGMTSLVGRGFRNMCMFWSFRIPDQVRYDSEVGFWNDIVILNKKSVIVRNNVTTQSGLF